MPACRQYFAIQHQQDPGGIQQVKGSEAYRPSLDGTCENSRPPEVGATVLKQSITGLPRADKLQFSPKDWEVTHLLEHSAPCS